MTLFKRGFVKKNKYVYIQPRVKKKKPGITYPKMLTDFFFKGVWLLVITSPLCFSVFSKVLPWTPISFIRCEEITEEKRNQTWGGLRGLRHTVLPEAEDSQVHSRGRLQNEDAGNAFLVSGWVFSHLSWQTWVWRRECATDVPSWFRNACIYSPCSDLSTPTQLMVS